MWVLKQTNRDNYKIKSIKKNFGLEHEKICLKYLNTSK